LIGGLATLVTSLPDCDRLPLRGTERFATFDAKLVKSAKKLAPGTVVAA
jgi:hypothetical protein